MLMLALCSKGRIKNVTSQPKDAEHKTAQYNLLNVVTSTSRWLLLCVYHTEFSINTNTAEASFNDVNQICG